MRNQRTGRPTRSVRNFCGLRGLAGAVALATAPLALIQATPAHADARPAAGNAQPGTGISDFYRARANYPLWLAPQSGDAAQQLLALLESASVDGLNPDRYDTRALAKALRSAANRNPRAVQRAEQMFAQAYVTYANDLRQAPSIGVYYVDQQLAPHGESARTLLNAAQSAPSLQRFVAEMGWMNPMYAQLRRTLAAGSVSDAQRRVLALNLERARQLPWGKGKYIVVNAAAQRLFMYEGGRMVGDMRVVVGKPIYPTPMMAAYIRFASLNPYWFVPPDLAAERIAPNVVKLGLPYLKRQGYQVMSDWSDNPAIVDPSTVDWKAVADGKVEVAIRQLPGRYNSMGRMKFMFPNKEGVYLHDTPEKELLTEASRLFSGGCVRLEDAPRLGAWMFGKALEPAGADAEQNVMLDHPVPVYISYLTAVPDGSSIAWFDDIYGRDAARIAQGGGSVIAAR